MLAFSIVAVLCIVKVGAECSHIRASFFGHRAAARVAAKGFKMTGGGEGRYEDDIRRYNMLLRVCVYN